MTAMPVSTPDEMSAAEAAAALGLSKNSVIRRVRAGQLAGYEDPIDHRVRVTRRAVERLLSERESLRRAAQLAE